jgi:hypothetical protein
MSDWKYLQNHHSEKLAKLHFFSVMKGEKEVHITVWEYAMPEIAMKFFARADVQLNQKTAPFEPIGWGDTLSDALSECLKNLNKFDYQP